LAFDSKGSKKPRRRPSTRMQSNKPSIILTSIIVNEEVYCTLLTQPDHALRAESASEEAVSEYSDADSDSDADSEADSYLDLGSDSDSDADPNHTIKQLSTSYIMPEGRTYLKCETLGQDTISGLQEVVLPVFERLIDDRIENLTNYIEALRTHKVQHARKLTQSLTECLAQRIKTINANDKVNGEVVALKKRIARDRKILMRADVPITSTLASQSPIALDLWVVIWRAGLINGVSLKDLANVAKTCKTFQPLMWRAFWKPIKIAMYDDTVYSQILHSLRHQAFSCSLKLYERHPLKQSWWCKNGSMPVCVKCLVHQTQCERIHGDKHKDFICVVRLGSVARNWGIKRVLTVPNWPPVIDCMWGENHKYPVFTLDYVPTGPRYGYTPRPNSILNIDSDHS